MINFTILAATKPNLLNISNQITVFHLFWLTYLQTLQQSMPQMGRVSFIQINDAKDKLNPEQRWVGLVICWALTYK